MRLLRPAEDFRLRLFGKVLKRRLMLMSLACLHAGNLPTSISERDVEDEFIRFGTLKSVWVARKPPGFGESTMSSLCCACCTSPRILRRDRICQVLLLNFKSTRPEVWQMYSCCAIPAPSASCPILLPRHCHASPSASPHGISSQHITGCLTSAAHLQCPPPCILSPTPSPVDEALVSGSSSSAVCSGRCCTCAGTVALLMLEYCSGVLSHDVLSFLMHQSRPDISHVFCVQPLWSLR